MHFQPYLQHLWIPSWKEWQIKIGRIIYHLVFLIRLMMTCISSFFSSVVCSRCPDWSNYQDSYSERSWTWHGEPAGMWHSCHWAQPLEDPPGHRWRQPQQPCNLSSAYTRSCLCGRCKSEYLGKVRYYLEVHNVRARLRFGSLIVEREFLKAWKHPSLGCLFWWGTWNKRE